MIHAPIDVTKLINHCSYGELFNLCTEAYKSLAQIDREKFLAENIQDADPCTIIDRYKDITAIF